MEGHHHDLGGEFPEHREKIHTLKLSDRHFLKLCEKYEDIDKRIARMESRIDLANERDESQLRKERLVLKDEIASYLAR